ncbi:MAG: type II toxin-antitoxin system RelE/ParE family toxin [Nocardioides sp.]
MTQLPVVFHPAVEVDLAEIYAHYRDFDVVLPERFEARLNEQVERLKMFPESGAILFDAYRRILVKRFPYIVVYRVGEERVNVLAIVSTARDPLVIESTVTERADG